MIQMLEFSDREFKMIDINVKGSNGKSRQRERTDR